MDDAESPDSASPWRRRFKWTVYALLVVDFIAYLYQDIESARHTLDAGSDLREVLAAYVTSIDLVAWFTLILLFELETWVLAGREWVGAPKHAVQGVRLLCYVAILHTSLTYDITVREFESASRLPAMQDLCAYTSGWSFLRNRDFLAIDADNCRSIGRGPEFFTIGGTAVITDREGLSEGTLFAWTDLIESLAWLLIVFATEAIVRLQHGRFAAGAATLALERLKIALYAVILAIAAWWGSKSQLLYFWDEMVWVLGFLVIDWNIRDRQTLRRALSVSPSAA